MTAQSACSISFLPYRTLNPTLVAFFFDFEAYLTILKPANMTTAADDKNEKMEGKFGLMALVTRAKHVIQRRLSLSTW
jgi:hypothetical protein